MSTPARQTEKFYRLKEAAEMASVHPDTVARAIRAGRLRAYRPGGGRLLVIAETDLLAWVRAATAEVPAAAGT